MKNPFWSPFSVFVIVFLILSGTVMLYPILAPEKNSTAYFVGALGFVGVIGAIRYIMQTTAKHKGNLIKHILQSNPIVVFEYTKKEWRPFAKAYIQNISRKWVIGVPLVMLAVSAFLFFIYINEGIALTTTLGIGLFLVLGAISTIGISSFLELKKAMLQSPIYKTVITKNGVVINNSFLISYNNEDNTVWSCSAHNFLDKDCIDLTIKQTINHRAQQKSFYLLIPQNKLEEKDTILTILVRNLKPKLPPKP